MIRKIKLAVMTLLVAGVCTSCGLLDTTSDEKLSGDEMWDGATSKEVEGFANSMYYQFRDATMQSAYFILYSGDLRCAPIKAVNDPGKNKYINDLATNDLNQLRSDYSKDEDKNADAIMRWQNFYKVVQSANILIKEVERAAVSAQQKQAFIDEAVFMRSLAYFFLVRAFGDVPYYTTAYNNTSLGRTNMVTVLKNISADLEKIINDDPNADFLPWTYNSATQKATRASRGSVLALLMHVNMWLAGFDVQNKTAYYQKVVDFGKQLVDGNGGNYTLLPMNQSTTLFAGASSEGIFEIAQNLSYAEQGEVFDDGAVFSNKVTFTPFSNQKTAKVEYNRDFLRELYPPETEDNRVTNWFNKNIYSTMATDPVEITKFIHTDTYGSNSTITSNSGNQIVFRLADEILLYAEALAELGTDDAKANELVNQIRRRAGAPEIQNLSGQNLKDAIFWERMRELIGEGHYYYDLVRTRKICDRNYSLGYAMTLRQFEQGAWTWPISKAAQNQNTHISLNNYWE